MGAREDILSFSYGSCPSTKNYSYADIATLQQHTTMG